MIRDMLSELVVRRFERRQRTPHIIRRTARLLHGRLRRIERDAVLAMQDRRLQRMMDGLTENSAFYRQRFREAGIDPAKVRTADDLEYLPLTSGADLRDHENDFRCVPVNAIAASFLSSGTAGAPKRIDYSFDDVQAIANNAAALLLAEHGDAPLTAAIAMPLRHGLWIGWRQSVWIIEKAGGLALPLGDEDPSRIAEILHRYDCNTVMSSPSFMLKLIQVSGERHKPPLSRIVLGSERLDEQALGTIREAFPKADVHTSYASTELGVGLASSWKNELPIVFNEMDLVVEIVDPETGEPVDEGELVFTTLSRRAMPLLRYRSGDRARWAEHGAPYALRAVEILGRIDDTLVIAGSKISAEAIAATIRDVADDVQRRVAMTVHRSDAHHVLTMRVEGTIDSEALHEKLLERMPRLRDHVRSGRAEVEIVPHARLDSQVKLLSVSQPD